MNGRCKQCRYWTTKDREVGICQLTRTHPRAAVGELVEPLHPASHARSTGSHSALRTNADFGCTQFAPAPALDIQLDAPLAAMLRAAYTDLGMPYGLDEADFRRWATERIAAAAHRADPRRSRGL